MTRTQRTEGERGWRPHFQPLWGSSGRTKYPYTMAWGAGILVITSMPDGGRGASKPLVLV